MNNISKDNLIAFENKVKELWEDGQLPYLLHLCGGNEDQLINIFKEIDDNAYIFSGHRSHYHYLLSGGDPQRLLDLIANGDSMFVFDKKRRFFTSSILGGTAAIAAGVALACKMLGEEKAEVWCFVGDGACDNGHVHEAKRFCASRGLPCVFIEEDNNRSVSTTKEERWGYVGGYRKLDLSYTYTPTYPHAGSGCNFKIEFKR